MTIRPPLAFITACFLSLSASLLIQAEIGQVSSSTAEPAVNDVANEVDQPSTAFSPDSLSRRRHPPKRRPHRHPHPHHHPSPSPPPTPTPPPPSVNTFTIYTNPNDSLLLQGRLPSGELIEWYGERDTAGLPTAINQIVVHKSNGEARYEFDDQARVSRAVATNGVAFQFQWISDTRAAVTAITPDGSQVSATVDLPQSAVSSSVRPQRLAATPAASTLTVPFVVNVSKCGGQPVNGATVKLQISVWPPNPLAPFVISRPAVPIGNGQYSGLFPLNDPNADARVVQAICEKLGDLLKHILCDEAVFDALCPSIGAALSLIPATLPEGLLILAACPDLGDVVKTYCAGIDDLAATNNGQIGDAICSAVTTVVRNILNPNLQYQLLPVVSDVPGLKEPAEGNSQIVSGATIGPLAPFTVDLGTSAGCAQIQVDCQSFTLLRLNASDDGVDDFDQEQQVGDIINLNDPLINPADTALSGAVHKSGFLGPGSYDASGNASNHTGFTLVSPTHIIASSNTSLDLSTRASPADGQMTEVVLADSQTSGFLFAWFTTSAPTSVTVTASVSFAAGGDIDASVSDGDAVVNLVNEDQDINPHVFVLIADSNKGTDSLSKTFILQPGTYRLDVSSVASQTLFNDTGFLILSGSLAFHGTGMASVDLQFTPAVAPSVEIRRR